MLRLKEEASEWIKFTLVMGLALNLGVWFLCWKELLPVFVGTTAVGVALLAFIWSLLQPRKFRGFYRKGMSFSYAIGQVMGKVLLLIIYFVVLLPMSLVVRLVGHDLLALKTDLKAETWWRKSKDNREFDRMF